MNKYLEKIAETKPDRKSASRRVGEAGASLVAGHLIARGPIRAISERYRNALIDQINAERSVSDRATIRKFMKDNDLRKNVTFNVRSHSIRKEELPEPFLKALNRGGGPAYVPNISGGRGFIIGVRRPNGKRMINKDVLMHELGHAKDYQRFGKTKAYVGAIGRSGIFTLGTAAALSNEKTRDYAPAVAAIPGVIALRSEGAANYHAYKGIKAHKGGKAANKFLKTVARNNMAHYGLAAAAPVAAAYAGKKILDKLSPRKGKEG